MLTMPLLAVVLLTAAQNDLTKLLTQDLSGVSTVVVDADVADVRVVTDSTVELRAKVALGPATTPASKPRSLWDRSRRF